MEIETWAANRLAEETGAMLAGGYVDVLDAGGILLARCRFADPPFQSPEDGSVAAYPFPFSVADSDGRPARFEAFAFDGRLVIAGTAGYRDDLPEPEMKFKTRQIVQDADVGIESFVVAVVKKAPLNDGIATA